MLLHSLFSSWYQKHTYILCWALLYCEIRIACNCLTRSTFCTFCTLVNAQNQNQPNYVTYINLKSKSLYAMCNMMSKA